MRIVVTGATGNIGSATLRELGAGERHEVIGLARRRPKGTAGGSVDWRTADVSRDDLLPHLTGADAVVHLAWKFQPTHHPATTWATNAMGTRRVLEAVTRAGVPAVVCASSVAAYSPVAHDEPVDESWRTDGASSAAYCREKAYVERALDAYEAAHPEVQVARLRPAFVFQRSAASEQRRIFGGPLLRPSFLDRRLIPVLPVPTGLRLQAVHAGDVARAITAIVDRGATGPFNIAGDGVLGRDELGDLVGARTVGVPARVAASALQTAWRLRLAPVPGPLLDAMMQIPLLDTARARIELDWSPQHTGADALAAMLDGAAGRAGSAMPPLHR